MTDDVLVRHVPVLVDVDVLRPHPRNYRTHTDDQLAHLCRSIEENGLYRNIVTAKDFTILAGHGVVQAARQLQIQTLPVIQLDLEPDDPRALKLLIGDNQIGQLASIDDRQLTDMLKEIRDDELTDLLGTGYDLQQLAALVMVTRPANEIQDFDSAAEWVGLPSTGEDPPKPLLVVVHCATEADRDAFFAHVEAGPENIAGTKQSRSIWWPLRTRSLRPEFEG